MASFFRTAIWILIAALGALGFAGIARTTGEPVNSAWLLTAAICTYLVAYRFYASFLAAKALALDDRRATPAERLRDGHDYEPTNKWIVFGHHFAAIAGPGPLVGPTLAAQFGFLPGFIWIVVGGVIGARLYHVVTDFELFRTRLALKAGIDLDEMAGFGGNKPWDQVDDTIKPKFDSAKTMLAKLKDNSAEPKKTLKAINSLIDEISQYVDSNSDDN